MKRLILAAGLFAATLTASLHAQTMNMQASIPFDFQIGSTVLPSGEYSIRHSGGLLFVTQTGGAHKSGMFLTVGEDRPAGAQAQHRTRSRKRLQASALEPNHSENQSLNSL